MKGNFQKLINGKKPILIDFHALWCGPCKMLAPVIKDVAKELKPKARVVKIDIDKNQMLAQQYKIQGVPTLALFKNGKVVWRKSGMQSKTQILNAIKGFL